MYKRNKYNLIETVLFLLVYFFSSVPIVDLFTLITFGVILTENVRVSRRFFNRKCRGEQNMANIWFQINTFLLLICCMTKLVVFLTFGCYMRHMQKKKKQLTVFSWQLKEFFYKLMSASLGIIVVENWKWNKISLKHKWKNQEKLLRIKGRENFSIL